MNLEIKETEDLSRIIESSKNVGTEVHDIENVVKAWEAILDRQFVGVLC